MAKRARSALLGLFTALLGPFCNAATTTPRMGLTVPNYGDQNWDVQLRADASIIDTSACVQGLANTFTSSQTFVSSVTFNSGVYVKSTLSLISGPSGSFYAGGGGNTTANGIGNTAFGTSALGAIVADSNDTAFGNNACFQITSNGGSDTCIGQDAGFVMNGGYQNTMVGGQSLSGMTTGFANVAVGFNAFNSNVGGSSNTAIGVLAGTHEFGSNNVYIGGNAGPSANSNLTNAIAIGANAVVNISSTMVLGNNVNVVMSSATLSGTLKVSSNTILPGATFYPSASAPVNLSTIQFSPTSVGIMGVTDGSSANSGIVAQYVSTTTSPTGIATAVNVPTNSQWGDIITVTLTAGDWDISAKAVEDRNTATNAQFTDAEIGISTVSGNNNATLILGDNRATSGEGSTLGIADADLSIPSYRVSITSSFTYILKCFAAYSGGQPVIYARMSARRIR